MKKKGFTLVEILIVVLIVALLATIVIPILRMPVTRVCIEQTNGKKALVYSVFDRYGYEKLHFRDVGFDGILDSVEDSNGLILDPNTIIPRSGLSVSWSTWVDRFEQEIRPEAVEN